MRRISERYIAGEELDDALHVVRRLNAEGKMATIDVLGEEIAAPDEARAIAAAYRETFEAIERGRLDSNVSVKPTALSSVSSRRCPGPSCAGSRSATSQAPSWRTRFGSSAG